MTSLAAPLAGSINNGLQWNGLIDSQVAAAPGLAAGLHCVAPSCGNLAANFVALLLKLRATFNSILLATINKARREGGQWEEGKGFCGNSAETVETARNQSKS